MKEEFELIAKTFQGLEEVLAKELTELGAGEIEIGRRMVAFKGDKEMMYRANFALRTAIRILKPIKRFEAKSADEVYDAIKAIHWEDYLGVDQSFSVDAVVFSNEFRHSKFVAYRVKDAIADYFREKTDKRPSVRLTNPDLALNIHIAETKCTLSLDSSGESLHRRGYRQEAVEAPLNEVLAAGMILMTGWNGECDLIDPMCGSGTIPIEAALIARNIAPGVFRKEYAFEKWPDFDQELFDAIYNDDSKEREFTHHIYGYDNNPRANEIATHNVKAAGVSRDVTLKIQPFQQFEQPAEKSLIITNPPYGERISTDNLLDLYKMIGERLKHAFMGNDAWILSYRDECFDQIGLKPSEKIHLFNGALECQFRKYQIFDGKYKAFRTEHNDKPFRGEKREFKGAKKPFRPSEDGERKPFRKSFRKEGEDGERKPFHKDGERKPFRKDGERKPFRKDGERKPFRPKRNEE
jgi:putative N6-adenine-specific DNA methylase